MAFKLAPRVRETTATTGTGTLSLGGATLAMQSFVAGILTGNTTRYCVVSGDGLNWEVGIGTVTAGTPDTLSRTTILASSNSGSHISLVGTSRVFCALDPFGQLAGAADVAIAAPADNDVLRYKNADAKWENESLSALLDAVLGSAQGDVLYRGASAWSVLAPGSAGTFLKTQGAAANPIWDTPAGSSTLASDTDVSITSLVDQEIIYYDNASSKWKNATLTAFLDLVSWGLSGAVQGNIIYRGAADWTVLPPGTAGQFLKTQGASANPIWAAGGGGGLYGPVLSAVPAQIAFGFTTQVQSSHATATFTDGATGISVTAASNSSNQGLDGVTKTAPSGGAKTATALVALMNDFTNGRGQVLFGYSDGTKIQAINLGSNAGAADLSLSVGNYTDKNTHSSDPFAAFVGSPIAPVMWLQVHDDGTTIHFLASTDGTLFLEFFSTPKSSGFLGSSGYSNIFFGINPYSTRASGTLMSYAET